MYGGERQASGTGNKASQLKGSRTVGNRDMRVVWAEMGGDTRRNQGHLPWSQCQISGGHVGGEGNRLGGRPVVNRLGVNLGGDREEGGSLVVPKRRQQKPH